MPNGGSDCCGTCCFNELRETPAEEEGRPRKGRCTLRGLDIDHPFHKYCINHPRHNRREIQEPIGPIFTTGKYPNSRVPCEPAPDSPEIRARLLALLDDVTFGNTRSSYPFRGMFFDAIVLNHLAELKERAALPGILRFLKEAKDKFLQPRTEAPTVRTAHIIRAAVHAALLISEGECLDAVKHWLQIRESPEGERLGESEDAFAIIRLGLVESLKQCPQPETAALLEAATQDPYPEIRKAAADILLLKEGDNN